MLDSVDLLFPYFHWNATRTYALRVTVTLLYDFENVTSDGFRLFEFLHYHGLRNGGTCKFLPRTLSKVYCSSLDF